MNGLIARVAFLGCLMLWQAPLAQAATIELDPVRSDELAYIEAPDSGNLGAFRRSRSLDRPARTGVYRLCGYAATQDLVLSSQQVNRR